MRAFTVQLEVFSHGRWQPAVRYDSAHGYAHRDRYFLDGRSIKTELHMDFNEALRDHWESYRDRFCGESEPWTS